MTKALYLMSIENIGLMPVLPGGKVAGIERFMRRNLQDRVGRIAPRPGCRWLAVA
jgi:hypothetical protein